MADITDSATRSRMMSGIKGKHTSPELAVRKGLHAQGLRFRLHHKGLPGRPDLVLAKYHVAVFVHGCFWHQHGCKNSVLPKTRAEFWLEKLTGNVERDQKAVGKLLASGWRVATIWECSVRVATHSGSADLYERLARWIRQGRTKQISF